MRDSLDKKIKRILNEEETFMLSLIMLSHLHDDEKYSELCELIFLFDNYKGFKQFIKYYGGKTIQVPTVTELKQCLRLLELFQKVEIDKKDFKESYNKLHLADLGLSETYCYSEVNKFKDILVKQGPDTLKQLKRMSKFI